jgi:hypothetical protein
MLRTALLRDLLAQRLFKLNDYDGDNENMVLQDEFATQNFVCLIKKSRKDSLLICLQFFRTICRRKSQHKAHLVGMSTSVLHR